MFQPLPPKNRSAPNYVVVATLRRPTYVCQTIRYQTRPGFWVPAALWYPAALYDAARAPPSAPGVLLVSGHTPDGFRANNLGGPTKDNAAPSDDEQVPPASHVERAP